MTSFGFVNGPRVSNREYLDTIPDDHPWKAILEWGAKLLDQILPGWKIAQIKEKFGGCRFYIDPPLDGDPYHANLAYDTALAIEALCDSRTDPIKQRRQAYNQAIVEAKKLLDDDPSSPTMIPELIERLERMRDEEV